jgi:dsDNA-specific endonuclease/ATPase MutS2
VDDNALNNLVDIERRRDEERKNDRVNAIERSADLLRSRFEGLLEQLARESITEEDLEKLEKKWERALIEAVTNLRVDFKSANEQQSKDIAGEFRGALSAYRDTVKDEQLQSHQAVIAAIHQRRGGQVRWVAGIVATIIGSVASTLLIVWLLGRP